MLKYYKQAALYPSVFLITFTFLFITYDLLFGEGYVSEWMTKESAFSVLFLMSLLYTAFVSLLTLPLFLNQYDEVKSNFWLSFLTWFVGPLSWIGYMVIAYFQSGMETFFLFLLSAPYLAGLSLSFLKFRKDLEHNSISQN